MAATDASGTATATAAYDEYGIPSGGNVGRFGYTGQAFLPEIGLSYYKARMYSPTLGRFMQTDPIGYGDGMNWYNYIGSNPVNATDPSGKMVQYCTGSILPSSTGCGGGASPMTTIGGTWSCTNCGEGAKSDGANGLVVNAPIWVFKPNANATSNMGYLPQETERQLTCQRVNFANRLLNYADALNSGGDKALQAAGASALVAIATSETVVGGVGFGSFATFAAGGGLLTKTIASGLSLLGHTVGSLATNNRSAFQNTFMNGVLGSASSGRGGVAGSLIEGAMQDAGQQPVPDRYTCPR